jgi:HSP20 family molecular chaperone IbpA
VVANDGITPMKSLENKGLRKMTKMTFASHPFLLGFEQLDRLVERTVKTGNDGYPPYNIEQSAADTYRITLAVAGFAEGDLTITLEDRQLSIHGRQSDEGDTRVFLHRGIAARQFQRTFVLAEGVEVANASMENGLLFVDLKQSTPDKIVQTIKITKG